MIGTCADFGVTTVRVPGRSGVWVPADERGPERKLGAIGLRVSRGVTMHGIALNCDVDLGWYDRFVPCGIADAGVSTLSLETGREVTVAEVLPRSAGHLADVLAWAPYVPDAELAPVEPSLAPLDAPRCVAVVRAPVRSGDARSASDDRPRHRDPRAAQGVPRASGHAGRRRPARPRGARWRRARFPRPQRVGQDHHDPDAARAGRDRPAGPWRSSGGRSPRRCRRSFAAWARSSSRRSSPPTSAAGRTCRCWRAPSGVPDTRVDAAVETVGLKGRDGDRYKSYSLGMKQRLAIAATLLKDPELLILDEPTNGLDPAGIREVRELVRGLGEAGVTVLLSSHILAEVQQVCTSATIIGNGRMLASGPVADLLGTSTVHRVVAPDEAAARAALESAGITDHRRGGRRPARRHRRPRPGDPRAGRRRASG